MVSDSGSHGSGSGADARPELPSRRVAVVDNSKDSADSLAMLLRFLGMVVHVSYDGASALAALPSFGPAIVLLDIGMPGMDGFEVARRMRQIPELEETVVVALTGWGQPEDRRRTAEAGFDHHLVKPLDSDALYELLEHPTRH